MATAGTPPTVAYIGRSYDGCAAGHGCHWSGMVDDLQLYNRALSATDIQAAAANGLLTPTGPVAMWKAEGNVNDSIGSDNGTPQGALTYAPGVSGQSFRLDGNTAAGLIGQPLNTRTQTFTIDGWIKHSSPTVASTIVATLCG